MFSRMWGRVADSTSADFCTILPDQGALEPLRGECGRGFSASLLLRRGD